MNKTLSIIHFESLLNILTMFFTDSELYFYQYIWMRDMSYVEAYVFLAKSQTLDFKLPHLSNLLLHGDLRCLHARKQLNTL